MNRAPGQILNPAKLLQAQRDQEEFEYEMAKEAKRKERDQYVKGLIKETNFGGREMEINKYRILKEQTEREEKEKFDRQERLEFRKQAEIQKQKFDTLKAKNIEELRKKREEEELQAQIQAKMAEKFRKEFLAKQKKKLTTEFQETYKARDDLILKKELNLVQ
jgi:hypothetical protein